jgi:hypothetical protein
LELAEVERLSCGKRAALLHRDDKGGKLVADGKHLRKIS